MLEVYSNNITVNAQSTIELNNISLVKGNTTTKNGNTISLNKCGVYEICVNGSVTVPTGGTVTIQMEKDNVVQTPAQTTITSTADEVIPFNMTTLVQVPFNNTPAPCSSPTLIEFISSVEATYNHINVVVTKLA